MSASQLTSSVLWKNGPKWLSQYEEESIESGGMGCIPEECLAEMTMKNRERIKTLTCIASSEGRSISSLIDLNRFSNLQRLLRVTAYVLRFIKILKERMKGDEQVFESDISATDLKEAEQCWISDVQGSLRLNKKFESWSREFDLFTDCDGLLRCRGRMSHAELPYTTKHPILLDSNHGFTALVIRDCHRRVMHNGVKETLTELRSKFWLVKGRQAVKKLLHNCVTCRRYEGKPYKAPPPPPLPDFRVTTAPAFTFTGLDYAGPLYVKEAKTKTGKKVWICLYTCCVTRAVHLDVVPDLTPGAFLRSFRRFTARRGLPSKIVSDNGTTFKSASKQLAELMNNPGVKQYLAEKRVQWIFNLERAPWWGGLFERMVRSMKRCLKKTIGGSKLTYEELMTVTVEVEMILNSRPLSYVSSEDVDEPLTPSHLLHGRRLLSLPDNSSTRDLSDPDVELSSNDSSKRVNHLNNVMSHFWNRWKNEYLMELRDSHRHTSKSTNPTPIAVGDMVVVHDEERPRGFWRLAKVEHLITGADGLVRGATIRVKPKSRRSSTLRRPIQLLYPLEIRSGNEPVAMGNHENSAVNHADGVHQQPIQPRRNPRRSAAVESERRRRAWIEELV